MYFHYVSGSDCTVLYKRTCADRHCCDRLKCERQDKLKLCSIVNSGVVNLSTNFIVLYL